MSEYVRRKDRGICITCGARGDWKDMNAGHFVHRDSLDFDLRNINCQCVHCNKFLHGNLNVYAERLMEKYGPDIIGELNRLGKCVIKFDREDLGKLINVLSEAVERLP